MTEPRLHVRTHEEDQIALIVFALDYFLSALETFHINRGDVQERCREAMVHVKGDVEIAAPLHGEVF